MYSPQFEEQLREYGIKNFLEGSSSYGYTFDEWTQARSFISSAFHKSGSVLDIGCGNGFLLRCLQEWVFPQRLIPFGIDVEKSFIDDSKRLFPHEENHFAVLSVDLIEDIEQRMLPGQYDFVYCSITHSPVIIRKLLRLINSHGRLIIGFYGVNNHPKGSPEQAAEKASLLRRISLLESLKLPMEIRVNPHGTNHIIAWIDVPSPDT